MRYLCSKRNINYYWC